MRTLTSGILAMMLVVLAVAPAWSAGQDEEPSAAATTTALERADLLMYVLGEAPQEMPEVLAKLNELTERDLNATIDIRFIPWGDVATRYPLLLSSGEDFDMIFSASWRKYTLEAKKGSFLPLNDLLPSHAPDLWQHMPDQAWAEARVDGTIYMVPNNDPSFNVHGFAYREDLRKKYGVAKPKRFEDMAAYFDAIIENEAGMIPFNEGNQRLSVITYYLETRNELRLSPFVGSVEYDVTDPRPEELESRWFSDVYREHYRLAKEWADRGYWSRDVLSNNINARDAFEQGTSGAAVINLVGFNGLYRQLRESHPNWELGWLDFTEGKARAQNAGYTGDGMSLNWATENPERSLMLLEKLHLDEAYAMLTYYGIEGKHYVLEDGKVYLPQGVEETGYEWDSYGWAWNEKQFVLPSATDWPQLADRLAEYETRQYVHPLPGFSVDQSDIAAELAAIQQVEQQYGYPLNWGLVADVEKAEALLFEKLREAGIERVLEVQRKQLADWQTQ